MHSSGNECNNYNRSENINQYNSGFKIIKFSQKNREFRKSRLLWIPRNVNIWVPSLILLAYTHQISALGDSSTRRYGVNKIFQRDARTYARTYAHTNIIPVGRKCSFGAKVFFTALRSLKKYDPGSQYGKWVLHNVL